MFSICKSPSTQRIARRTVCSAIALIGGGQALAQVVHVRIVEAKALTAVTSTNPVLDLAVQAKVDGGAGLGAFGFSLVIPGEGDDKGTWGWDRIMSTGGLGTYYTGSPQSMQRANVDQAGVARQYGFLTGVSELFNGVPNAAVSQYQNTATNQELFAIHGAAMGQQLLTTPGVDDAQNGWPSTWTGGVPANGAVAPLDAAVGASYFASGQFVDLFRCRFTVSGFDRMRMLNVGFGSPPSVQTFTQYVLANSNWKAQTAAFAGTLDAAGLGIPVCSGWVGGATPPANSAIRASATWSPQYTDLSNELVAKQLVIAYDKPGGGASISTWNGTAWTTLATSVSGTVYALAVDATTSSPYHNKLVAAGSFSSIDGVSVSNIAYYDGAAWRGYGSGMNGPVYALLQKGYYQFFAGGSFTSADGNPVSNLAVWAGTTWEDVGGGTDGPIKALCLHGTKVAVGGSFTIAGTMGIGRGVAMWDPANELWQALGASGTPGIADGEVRCFHRVASNALVVGGHFSSVDGVAGTANIASWNGTSWSALGSGLNGDVNSMAPSTGAMFFVGGDFTASGSASLNRIARLQGSAWSSLGSGVSGTGAVVNTIAMIPSGEVISCGSFSTAGGSAAPSLARWSDTGKPWIAVQPTMGQAFVVGGSMTSTVVPAVGYDWAGPLSYQWKWSTTPLADGTGPNGEVISGATSPTLSITNLQTANRGNYSVKVANPCGYATSVQSSVGSCASDHNGNGMLEVQDIFDFLNDWFAVCIDPLAPTCAATADFNNSGALEVQDIFDFLNGWFAGCS